MEFKNILIFRIGYLGDNLAALPSLWAIKNSFPNAKISLLTNIAQDQPNLISAVNVLPQNGLIDEFITYPQSDNWRDNIRNSLKIIRHLKKKNFDCLIYLMTRNRTVRQIRRDKIFFRLAGLKNVIGIEHLTGNLLKYDSLRPLPTVRSEANFLLDSLRQDKFFPSVKQIYKTDLLLEKSEISFAEEWFSKNCANAEDKFKIAVAPGGKWESKIWDSENYLSVIIELIEKYDVYPIIFGGAEDAEKGSELMSGWQIGANAAGKFTIRESAAALSKCDLYLGNDTGTMHLAAAVGTPCVAIFAAIDYPGRWHPFGNNNHVFRRQVSCEGCHSANCPNENLCLKLITPSEVFSECEKRILAKKISDKRVL